MFDFLVVAIAVAPASGAFGVLRALRVLRVLRLLTMLNLFIAIFVNAMQTDSDDERSPATHAFDQAGACIKADMYGEFCALREEMRRLRGEIGGLRNNDGDANARVAST